MLKPIARFIAYQAASIYYESSESACRGLPFFSRRDLIYALHLNRWKNVITLFKGKNSEQNRGSTYQCGTLSFTALNDNGNANDEFLHDHTHGQIPHELSHAHVCRNDRKAFTPDDLDCLANKGQFDGVINATEAQSIRDIPKCLSKVTQTIEDETNRLTPIVSLIGINLLKATSASFTLHLINQHIKPCLEKNIHPKGARVLSTALLASAFFIASNSLAFSLAATVVQVSFQDASFAKNTWLSHAVQASLVTSAISCSGLPLLASIMTGLTGYVMGECSGNVASQNPKSAVTLASAALLMGGYFCGAESEGIAPEL